MKRLGVVLPVLLAAALLGFALSLGNLGEVLARIRALPVMVLLFALLMGVVYLGFKLWQFRLLLANLDLNPDLRALLLAFSVGELALTLPLGIFAQNWVLGAVRGHARFGRSSAATVVMLLVEMWVVLLLLAAVEIPGWPALQPLAAACAAGLVVFSLVALRYGERLAGLETRVRHPWLRLALAEASALLHGCRRLSGVRVLVINALLAAAYLGALVLAFTTLGRQVGVDNLGYLTAASIYAFSLAVILLGGGLLSQIGTVEVLGIGAAQAWGLSLTDGLALMLTFRVVWTGVLWLLNLPLVCLLWLALRSSQPASADHGQKSLD